MEKWRSRITLKYVYGIESERLTFLTEWLTKFFIKHEEKLLECNSKTETELLNNFRTYLIIKIDGFYWHLAYGDKVEKVSYENSDESAATFEINNLEKNFKKNLIAFQKKGRKPSLFQKSKSKARQIATFFSMMFMFLIMVTCRKFDFQDNDIPENSITEKICKEKNPLLFFFGIIIFGSLGSRFFSHFLNSRKLKNLNKFK